MQHHGLEVVGTTIGAIVGIYKSIAAIMIGVLTWPVFFESILLSSACAFAGLLITHFGKKLLKKLGW